MRFILVLVSFLSAGQQGNQPAGPVECADLPQRLDACAAYTCTFTHPFTRQPMERKVVGLKGDTCEYVEQMPGGGTMACSYPEATRRDVASFYRATQAADTMQARARVSGSNATTSTTIDGKPVANPLDAALKAGVCTVTGYGSGTARPARSGAPAPASAPAPAATSPSSASSLPAGTASGSVTVKGVAVALTHAYAFPASASSVLLVASSAPLSPAQARSNGELEKLARSGNLHAVVAVVDRESKAVSSMHVIAPAFQYAVFVAPSNRALSADVFDAGSIAGQLGTIRAGAFAGTPYEVRVSLKALISTASR